MCASPLRIENAKSATRSLFCTRAQKEIEKVRASLVEKKEYQYYNKSSHPNNTFAEMTWEDGGWKGPCGQGVALYKGICILYLVFGVGGS